MKNLAYLLFFPILLLILSLPLPSCVSGRRRGTPETAAPTSSQELLPVDPEVKIGVLANGLTYYIRENGVPERRAELRLVLNAGSILEDDDQLGLAHFLEHMAFNGTRNFEKQEIVDYLESIGMRFGPDLNAYTTYDETVYMLQVPTDREETLETAVHILDEWARFMTLEEEEIDKERKVIVEEWRFRRDAESRIREKHAPVLFYGSRYADRNPIGDMEIIKEFQPEVLRRFYRDWYRPDLMAVVAVGDFDAPVVEGLIKKHFIDMKSPSNARERTLYPVPDHPQTLYSIVTDREATSTRISIITKKVPKEVVTLKDYRDLITEYLFHGMLNARLDELAQGEDAPFISAYSGSGRVVRSSDFSILGAGVKEDGIERGFESLITEEERVKRYGFTLSEFDRQKKVMLSYIEKIFSERDKLESNSYISEYVSHYLEGETIPGIEYERELYGRFLPEITIDEMNSMAATWFTEGNRVVLVSAPEKEGQSPGQSEPPVGGEPSARLEFELREIHQRVLAKQITPYEDRVPELPLLALLPEPGSVTEERKVQGLGLTEWVLSNGARVMLKPTEFKNNQILFGAYSPGGHSLAPDEKVVAARTAADLIAESGVGGFSRTELEKKLAGKIVEVSPWIDDLYEGLKGSSTPTDLETLFQLVYLTFTQPRKDEQAFTSYRDRLKTQLKNREASPDAAFWDALQETMSGNHPRARPLKSEMLPQLDLDASFDFFRDQFSDAGDFTFFFVGNFEPGVLRPLVETYLASLPSTGRQESWRDLGIRPPEGVVKATVKMGIERKSSAAVAFNGPMDWSLENVILLKALGNTIEIPLRETLREKQGGTYDVSVYAMSLHFPRPQYRIYILFGTAPEQVEDLLDQAFRILREVREKGPRKEDVEKVREILRRERETNLQRNEYWLSLLQSYYMNDLNPLDILEYDRILKELSVDSLQKTAEAYLLFDNYVQVVLYPEGWDLLGWLLDAERLFYNSRYLYDSLYLYDSRFLDAIRPLWTVTMKS